MAEMTIDEALKIFKKQRKDQNYDVGDYREWGTDQIQAADVIIKCIENYQLIEQIVDAYVTDNHRELMYDTEDYMESIKEVIKWLK